MLSSRIILVFLCCIRRLQQKPASPVSVSFGCCCCFLVSRNLVVGVVRDRLVFRLWFVLGTVFAWFGGCIFGDHGELGRVGEGGGRSNVDSWRVIDLLTGGRMDGFFIW